VPALHPKNAAPSIPEMAATSVKKEEEERQSTCGPQSTFGAFQSRSPTSASPERRVKAPHSLW
jgi:hypothetical protein